MISRPSRILLIEDDAPTREILGDLMRGYHCDLITAADGREGLWRFEEQRPDLVLLDLFLPGLDGFEVFRRLRERSPGLPIVILTGHLSPQTIDRVNALGFAIFARKPIDMNTAFIGALLCTLGVRPAPEGERAAE